jgi:DNA-binding transcriptional ArsR family regulator/uncharacterized protein YndB with AHSA1/START domain
MLADVEAAFDAFGDPTRRAIIGRLAFGPSPVGQIAAALPVGRPAVSMHLRVLKNAGLVDDRPAGTQRLYQLNPAALMALRDYLDWHWTHALAAFKSAVEQPPQGGNEAVAPELSVVKFIVVDVPRVEAFAFFLEQERWWPVATHHLAEPAGETVVLEPFVGGRWFERTRDGTECDWGRVLVWEPPQRLVLTWQISPGWVFEPDPLKASEIEVRFVAESSQRTRIELEHRHLERYSNNAERMRSILDAPGGAASVLTAFAAAIDGAPVARTASIA